MTLHPTPTRLWLLRQVAKGEVYREAGEAWHQWDGSKLTARMAELTSPNVGWAEWTPGPWPTRQIAALTREGRRVLDAARAGERP